MDSWSTTDNAMPPIYEIQHLRKAFERLEGLGPTNSPTIDNLKRIVLLRVAELEASLERTMRASARELRTPSATERMSSAAQTA
jgi:hypothetical protein